MGQLPQTNDDSRNLDEQRLGADHVSQWTLGGHHHPWTGKSNSISELSKPLMQNPWNTHTPGPWVDVGWHFPIPGYWTFGKPGVASPFIFSLPPETTRNSKFWNNDFTHLSLTLDPSHPDQPCNYEKSNEITENLSRPDTIMIVVAASNL